MWYLNAKLLNGTVLSLVTAWSAKLSHLGLNELPHCLDWSIQLPYAPASCNGPSAWAGEKNLDSYSGGSCWTASLGPGPDIAFTSLLALKHTKGNERDAVPPALITHRSGTPAKTISASAGSVELLHPMEKQPDDANKQWNEISSKGKFMVLGGGKKASVRIKKYHVLIIKLLFFYTHLKTCLNVDPKSALFELNRKTNKQMMLVEADGKRRLRSSTWTPLRS